MYLPPIQPMRNEEIFVSGDVIIHESAVIAPGTILQATANSRIVIGEGTSIGMGTILSTNEGAIVIEAGAILGAGVLIVGQSTIGSNACIGAATTIFNASIQQMTVIPAGSLIGDRSRQVAFLPQTESINLPQTPNLSPEIDYLEQANNTEIEDDLWATETETKIETAAASPVAAKIELPTNSLATEAKTQPISSPVVGQVYINQLLVTLFPERHKLKRLL